jgi:hypothetical protein
VPIVRVARDPPGGRKTRSSANNENPRTLRAHPKPVQSRAHRVTLVPGWANTSGSTTSPGYI